MTSTHHRDVVLADRHGELFGPPRLRGTCTPARGASLRAPPPPGVAVFAEDYAIRRYGEVGNNIVHWTEFDRGGHFAAMEEPELLVEDVRGFFRRFR
jgi:hypothetical protein